MIAAGTPWGQEVVDLVLADGVFLDDVRAIKDACEKVLHAEARAWAKQLQIGDIAKVVNDVSPKYIRGLKVVVRDTAGRGSADYLVDVHEDDKWKVGNRRFRSFRTRAEHLEPA